jgi:hypothetical protein
MDVETSLSIIGSPGLADAAMLNDSASGRKPKPAAGSPRQP